MSKLRYYSNIILSNLAESVFKLGIMNIILDLEYTAELSKKVN